jgi:hypothetical protein
VINLTRIATMRQGALGVEPIFRYLEVKEMSEQNLRELIGRLRAEIAALPDQDIDARSRLEGIVSELETRLDGDKADGAPALKGSIQDTIHQLEARHPDATTVLNNIMMTLANMGI